MNVIQQIVRRTLRTAVGTVATATFAIASLHAQLPAKLTDTEFWKIVTDFSEPAGIFPSENFTSNELGFQAVIPELKRTTQPGGVYMGVGPEQNFTYIVGIQPKMAFITDIRRQNMIQHLIYKAMMEQFDNRADFLAHLFSVERPAGLDTNSTAQALFDAYGQATPDSLLRDKNIALVLERLTKTHGFVLSDSDKSMVNHVITAFYQAGTRLNYGFRVNGTIPPMGNSTVTTTINGTTRVMYIGGGAGTLNAAANYASLMEATDGAGVNRSYLATEANYRFLRDLEMRNMLVPLVGNFGGDKALRAVGTYLKEHQATVTAFYCSNVEQYLFPAGGRGGGPTGGTGWAEFYNSVATLPLDSVSTFIRSGGGGGGGGAGSMNSSVLASMMQTVTAFKAGQITSRQDVLNLSHGPR